MSLGDHLEELRYRLFLGAIGPVIFAIVLMFFSHTHIVPFLCKPLLLALQKNEQQPSLVFLNVGDAFGVYLRVALIGGLVIGIPWLFYHLWQFVAAGLYAHERRYVNMLVPFSALMAAIGCVFMYFVALPFTLWFLVGFGAIFPTPELSETYVTRLIKNPTPAQVEHEAMSPTPVQLPIMAEDPPQLMEGHVWIKSPEYEIRTVIQGKVRRFALQNPTLLTPQLQLTQYISFVLWLGLAFSISFQLPLVMLGLGFSRLFTVQQMAQIRKFAILGSVVVGSVLTPPDLFSLAALAVPLYLLYEFGLVLVRIIVKPSADSDDGDDADSDADDPVTAGSAS